MQSSENIYYHWVNDFEGTVILDGEQRKKMYELVRSAVQIRPEDVQRYDRDEAPLVEAMCRVVEIKYIPGEIGRAHV